MDSKGGIRKAAGTTSAYYVKYGDRIERIAIVGPERWRSETLMFAGVRRAPVGFFVDGAIAEARAWLTA